MTMTEDDANTLATDLKDKAPAPLEKYGDDISALSSFIRTSKAERIAGKRVLEISKQHQLALAKAKADHQKMKEDLNCTWPHSQVLRTLPLHLTHSLLTVLLALATPTQHLKIVQLITSRVN